MIKNRRHTKLIMENWRRFLNENVDDIENAKEILSKNTYLSRYADSINQDSLVYAGDYVFLNLPSTFHHAKTSHTRQSDLPGSKFGDKYLNDTALVDLVVSLLTNSPEPDERQTSPYGDKLKWFNRDMGAAIGEDSIVHKDQHPGAPARNFDYREKIGNNRAIPAIMNQGLKVLDSEGNVLSNPDDANPDGEYHIQQDVPVVDGPLVPTSKLNLIVGELGKLGDKTFVSLVTMFPGVSEPSAMNKQDYAKLGYYFLTGKA